MHVAGLNSTHFGLKAAPNVRQTRRFYCTFEQFRTGEDTTRDLYRESRCRKGFGSLLSRIVHVSEFFSASADSFCIKRRNKSVDLRCH